jgi:hypothetical protein
MSDYVSERRQELYDYCRDRPHIKLRISGVANALERRVDSTLSIDLAAIRHWARDDGAIITNCYFDHEDKTWVFRYLPPKDEAMQSVIPLRTQSRQARSRLVNLGSQAGYTAKNAVRKEDRAYARLQAKLAGLYAGFQEEVERFERSLRNGA